MPNEMSDRKANNLKFNYWIIFKFFKKVLHVFF